MIADLRPYPEYKESGLPWLGQVPGHWETRRLRHACEMRVSNVDKHTKQGETPVRLCNYVEVYKNERIRESTRFMAASASEDERIRFCLRKGDVLITKDSEQWNDIGVPSLVEFEAPDLVCGYHLAILRARPLLRGPFLHRALECHFIAAQFHVEANGVTRYGLSHGAIQGVSIPLPPPAEQAAIVRFLDWANGRLEWVIRAKRKVIALLTEQKQAIIHRAVTRGLDPSVFLKPSGIPWLGDIPQHWGVLRAKYLYREVDERSADGSEELLSVSHLTGVTPRSQKNITMFKAASYAGHKLCRRGDLVVNTMWAWMGALGVSAHAGIISPAYAVYRPRRPERIVGAYMDGVLRSRPYVSNMICRSTGLRPSRLRLYPDEFFRLPIIQPPSEEQQRIVQAIRGDTADLNTAVSRLEREIELLREYRTRLVADVVTGKLDVREAAARLPDETEEPKPVDEADSMTDADEDATDDLDTALEEPKT